MFNTLRLSLPINLNALKGIEKYINLHAIFSYFLYIYVFLMVISFLIYIIGLFNKRLGLKINNFINFYVTLIEKEIMNLSLLVRLGICLFLFFACYNYNMGFLNNTAIIFPISIYALILLFIAIFIIPCYLIFSYGAYFIAYIKGGSLKKNIFFEFLTDSLNLLSFFLRINIQFIRIALILFMFILYDEQYYSMVYP
jgi:hypothetical protein